WKFAIAMGMLALGLAASPADVAAQARPAASKKAAPLKDPTKPLAVPAHHEATAPAAGTVRLNSRDGLKYVWIAPGLFQMGCSPGDDECNPDEKPAHPVTITREFWLGQTEVTVGAYK